MPHLLGKILVVTKDELIPAFFPTYEALKKKLKRYENKAYGIKRYSYGGNGRQLLVLFDSLDAEIQDKLGDLRKDKHPLEAFYQTDTDAVTFYTKFKYPDGRYLLPDTVEKNIINASVLTALVKLEAARENERIAKRGSLRGILKTIFEDAMAFNSVLEKKHDEKHTLNTSYPRFKAQYKSFKDDSYTSLIKDIEGKSKRNALKLDAKTTTLLNDLFGSQNHKPTATEVAGQYEAFLDGYVEIVNQSTGEVYDREDYKPLSYSSITHWLSKWESKIGTHAKRSGDRQQLLQKFVPYDSMEAPSFAGSIISIDDRQPPFWYEKGKRMWWYLGIDLASEAITCWSYGKSKEGIIQNFYQNMIRNYHQFGVRLPHQLECESALNSSFKNTFLKDGAMFQDVDIHANSARSKRIERFFGEIRYRHEKKREGWIGRPFARNESNQAGAEPTKIIPYDDLVQQGMEDIYIWNNSEHSKIKGKSRWEVFMETQNPDLVPTNYKAILPHLGNITKSSCNAGIMKLQNAEWLLGDEGEIYTGERLITLLKLVEGMDIDIHWINGNEGEVIKALVMKEGRVICEAIQKPKAARAKIEATQSHIDARELMHRYRATVTTYMQMQKNSISQLEVIDNRKQTISDSFQMPGLKRFTPRQEPSKAIEEHEDQYIYTPKSSPSGENNGLRKAFNI